MSQQKRKRDSGEKFKPPKQAKKDAQTRTVDTVDAAPSGDPYDDQWKALGAWFLGPRAENKEKFLDLFKVAFDKHVQMRQGYYPMDPAYITEDIKSSDEYQSELKSLKEKLLEMNQDMFNSVPFFSPRYQAHMCWDVSMPALLGYMSSMLYNQNNADSAASPVTTLYEKSVGLQLCDMLGFDINSSPKPWGHITCGGSIANIESLWAARNLKFHPLAVKYAVENSDGVLTEVQKCLALECSVWVPAWNHSAPLCRLETWELLNLNVDDACDLTRAVTEAAGLIDKDQISAFDSLIERYSYTSLGIQEFMKLHSIEQSAVYTCPANCHYSWPKAGTLLGLGSGALVPVPIDINFRQDVSSLEDLLLEKLANKVPVISVTAVMGSTEESAVDPIKDILALRDRMRSRGLNFAVLADAAWGGYFKTMLREKVEETQDTSSQYVPFCPLTDFVKEQYENIQHADTITIDPHKSGFCPYPSGALCYRNGTMRAVIAIMHPEVYHGEDDPTMGVYGIEGSKPGAAPAGVYLSHSVIGLDNYGYGRILGQCTSTAKLFYCLWMVVARDEDPFICQPLQMLPPDYTMEKAKDIIRNKILGKAMHEIIKDDEAKQFLLKVGPDTLINTFVVNPKDNQLVSVVNSLQTALSNELNIMVGTSAKRIPLMVMQSGLNAENHGVGLIEYKKRLGLQSDTGEDMSVMVNTTMNPWQWNESIDILGDLLRVAILNCIGKLKDIETKHSFVICGSIEEDNSFFAEFLADFQDTARQYHAIAKFQIADMTHATKRKFQRNTSMPWTISTVDNAKLYLLLKEPSASGFYVNVYGGDGHFIDKVLVKVIDVPRYQHFDMSIYPEYPEKQKYFMYGDKNATYISHCITKSPDFQQVVKLDGQPHSVTDVLLDLGNVITLDDVDGDPLIYGEQIVDPLQATSYNTSFIGNEYTHMKTTIFMTDPQAKIYFNVLQ